MDSYGFTNVIVDGLNELGMSAALLWIPAPSQRQDSTAPGSQPWIPFANVASWLLGTCSSVKEAKDALAGVHLTNPQVDQMWPADMHMPSEVRELVGWTFSGVIALHDSSGSDLVVEMGDGGTQLTARDHAAVGRSSVQQAERLVQVVAEATSPREGLTQTFHILGRVALPRGYAKTGDYTLWSAARDHTDRMYAVRTYDAWETHLFDLRDADYLSPGPIQTTVLDYAVRLAPEPTKD